MKLKFIIGKQSIRYITGSTEYSLTIDNVANRRLVYDAGETLLYKILCNLFSKLALLLPRYVQ